MEVGEVVADRYELEQLLGVGGMADVYRARDRVLERRVALKVLHERHSDDPEYVERFRREARAIARLSHPNIVTVIDRGEYERRPFIVFEYIDGETLKDLLADDAPLPVGRALTLAHQAARGLAYAHANGIVHRDVKPQNVIVDADGVAKVTDFGIARSRDPDAAITLTGTVMGTADYISPEQANGERADGRSDQYSLGALLYELLTGEVPYPGDSVVTVAMRHLHDPVPSVREKRPDASPRVDALIRRAMAKNPDDRFPSMDTLIAALEACMAEDAAARSDEIGATQILPVASPQQLARSRARERRPRRRRPLRMFVAGVLVLGLGAVAVALVASGTVDVDGGGDGGAAAANVRLRAASDYDPEGGDGEHPELVGEATDGDRATWWRTEIYGNFEKSGVGIVVDAGRRRGLSELIVFTDTPGFTAEIQAGDSEGGPFNPVSREQEVAARTVFRLDGGEHRYYLIWITDLDEVAHVNEVRAR